MAICDNCIHDEVCGLEGHLDEALTFCANKVTDVQPVKRGRWDFQGYQLFKCTNCTKIYTQEQLEDIGENWTFPNFCPNCGAKMIKDGEQNDD